MRVLSPKQKPEVPAVETPNLEFQKLMRTVLVFRLAVVTVILGTGLVFLSGVEGSWHLLSWALLLGATYLLTAASWAALRRGPASSFLVTVQLGADVAVASAVVHLGGGYESPFTFLYVLCVLSGAALRSGWGAVTMATVTSVAYGGLALLELNGYVATTAPLRLLMDTGPSWNSLMHVVLQVCFFHLTGAATALMAERVRSRGDELRAKDRALREARLNTDTIIQSMGSGLMTVDNEGLVVHLNRAAEGILGCGPDEAIGRPFPALLEDRCPEFSRALSAALSHGETPSRMEATVTVPGGDRCPVGISVSLLHSPEGDPAGVVAIFQDLTDVKQMAERVRQADRLAAVGQLAGAVAHEIRNPLASISGSVEMLAADLPLEGDHRRLLDLVLRESDHLKRLTRDFLTYGRLKPKEAAPVDVGRLISEACCLLRHMEAVHDDHEIRREGSEGGIWADWDGEQMRQVLVNVGLNALQAMPDGGTLTARTEVVPWESPRGGNGSGEAPPRAVRIVFEDTGKGMDADSLRRVFEPFFTTKAKGTGLGLAIVARIVEDHGGLIDIRSHLNEGTRFTLTVPGVRDGGVAEDVKACREEEPLALPA